MARDGYRDFSIKELRKIAETAIVELDGRHGDPSRRASWIRERRLAHAVYALIARIDLAQNHVEIPNG